MYKRITAVTTLLLMAALAVSIWALFPQETVLNAAASDTSPSSTQDQAFPHGRVFSGFVEADGRTYYFGEDGVPLKGGIVGSEEEGYTLADENGVCCVSPEIRLAAAFMMKYCEGDTLEEKMKTGFLYLARKIPYHRSYEHDLTAQDMSALAVDMFTNLKGNCYRYAACFACIAKIAGYRVRVVLGTTVGNPHGWVEVLVGRRWMLCDPDTQMAEPLLPDYAAYMMKKHWWQITPEERIELSINEDGVAVWNTV